MAEKQHKCERKRKLLSSSEPATLLQAASELCSLLGIDANGNKSANGLFFDYK